MELTCPHCRHVVAIAPGGAGRCENCGTKLAARTAPSPPPAAAAPAKAEPAPPTTAPPPGAPPQRPAVHATAPTERPTRAAAIVALVCGLLFFIPVVPQAAAILFGAIAVFRRRLPNERVAAAWVGLLFGLAALAGWFAMYSWINSPTFTRGFRGMGYWTPPPPQADERAAAQPGEWAELMERASKAAADYHRDYRKWPANVQAMVGIGFLPAGFELPEAVIYHRPPDGLSPLPADWVLFSTAPTSYDRVQEPLPKPHRLVVGADGIVHVRPADEVEAAIARQERGP